MIITVQHRPLVLLAEDNVMQSQLIKRVFERYHFDVHTVSNGQMALDTYKSNPNFVLVLMVCRGKGKKRKKERREEKRGEG